MLKVTVDTMVLINGFDGSESDQRVLRDLRKFRDAGLIDLARSSRFHNDKERDEDRDRVERHYVAAGDIPIIPGPGRFDASRYDSDLMLGEDTRTIVKQVEEVFHIANPASDNQHTVDDVDHLVAHRMANRDYFLTSETRILNKLAQLRRLGIVVVNPERFVEIVNNAHGQDAVSPAEVDAALAAVIEQSQL